MRLLDPTEFDRAQLARCFACAYPSRMRWQQDGNLFQCRGCPSACGTNNASHFKPAPVVPVQADLFGQQD